MATSLFFTLLILNFLSLSSCIGAIPNLTTDQSALLTFKQSITDGGGLANTWSTNTSICFWAGVFCGTRHQRVTALNVSGLGLAGTIPPHLGNLTFLRSLDISFNNFSGLVPSELSNLRRLTYVNMAVNNFTGEIPAWFGKIQVMNLDNNSFSGGIPTSLFNVSTVVEISLRFNKLSGELSNDEICRNTPKLKALYLSGNQIAGEIPANIYRCGELVDLRLAINQFSGSIPAEIGNLTKLTVLNLRSNKLQGSIPEKLGNFASLETLNLQSNNLTGSIPEQFGNLTSLEDLLLRSNLLTGPIPKQFGNLALLRTLDLSLNSLSGPIPKQFGNMTSLTSLELFANRLSGQVPEELGNLAHLEMFHAGFNDLNGSIPPFIFNFSTLTMLGLQQNQFSGTLPPTMGLTLPNLQGLSLFLNKLSGPIPTSINNASQLTIIELNRNSFTGPIPHLPHLRLLRSLKLWENNLTGADSPTQELTFLSSLTNCPYLEALEFTDNPLVLGLLPPSVGNLSTSLNTFLASTCDIRGPIPPGIGNLTSLRSLHLSGNQLTGFIPPELGKLKNLQRLYLGDNRLQGDIPRDLCQLNKLGELNLSSNMLTGQLHECFGQLTSLRNVSFASNNLSSGIPSEFWDLADLVTLDLYSNNFSGEISSQIGNLKALGQIDMSFNQFSGKIPNSLGDCLSLEFLSLSNNNLSGSIPTSLESLRGLQFFDVSYNKLDGEIPNGGPFANFTAQSFLNNSALCGEERLQVPPCPAENAGRSKNFARLLKYIVPPFVFVITLVVIIVIFIRRRKQKKMPSPVDLLSAVSRIEWRRISYIEIERGTSSFSEANLLGRGGYGSVYQGILSDGLDVAAKVFNLDLEGATKSFDTESEILSSLRHRNLVRIIGCCVNIDFRALILAYMPNGNLEKWLHSDSCFLDLVQRLQIAIDVALALEYLHHGHTFVVVHCDIKPSNVLLDKDMIAHVGDFGISKLFDEGQAMVLTKTLATVGYAAPEYGSEGKVSTNGDVYSYGILLLEMFTQKKPTDDMFSGEMNLKEWVNEALQEDAIGEVVAPGLLSAEDRHFETKEQCVSSILDLGMKCVAFSPEERMNMVEVVATLQKIKAKITVEEDGRHMRSTR